jgi:orotate phosphoribosyltransferase
MEIMIWLGKFQVKKDNPDEEANLKFVHEDQLIFNPFTDMDRFRREAFRRIPGVVNESEHIFRTGRRKDYYIDFDPLINDPIECRSVVDWYVEVIKKILSTRQIDILGFIEKDRDSGGTIGALRLAGAISIATDIPNITIRLGKELIQERIKLRTKPDIPLTSSLSDLSVVLITDHSTTGLEAIKSIRAVKYRGGKVTDFIAYSIIKPEYQYKIFQDQGIEVHSFLNAPDDLIKLGFKLKQETNISS